jgi:hypothetical protein
MLEETDLLYALSQTVVMYATVLMEVIEGIDGKFSR